MGQVKNERPETRPTPAARVIARAPITTILFTVYYVNILIQIYIYINKYIEYTILQRRMTPIYNVKYVTGNRNYIRT